MTQRKAIFITGGASGIGREVAKYFGARGWFVGLADLNAQGMRETAALLPAGASTSHMLDVRDAEQWKKALADFWTASGGRLDVLFNNAGIARGGPFAESTQEDNDLLIDINLRGVIRGAEAGFQYLSKTPNSCLLSTSSAAGIYGPSGIAVYGATKFGVRGLTEALDSEWAQHGIRAKTLMPSFVDTPLLDLVNKTSNQSVRETVSAAGLEISPVSIVAEAAWEAVHNDRLHTTVGKTAKRLAFLARFMPWLIRKQSRVTSGSVR